MYARAIAPLLKEFAAGYPGIWLTGPRQSGKTTLARALFPHLPYVSLENVGTREKVLSDPEKFLQRHREGVILDEVQNTPDLLSYLQQVMDESSETGRFVITGSQNFSLTKSVSQSLAGRVGVATLLPLSLSELGMLFDIQRSLIFGGYPRLHQQHLRPTTFYPGYLKTYLERDVNQIGNIKDHNLFQKFMRLCAGRIGQLLDISTLAVDCGITQELARTWLNILAASYVIFLLPSYHKNVDRRVIKMPKLYFYDTGLACSLLKIKTLPRLEEYYNAGALFENLVILEVLKTRLSQGDDPSLYFWRDKKGYEVDLIEEWGGGKLRAMEIKSSMTFHPEHTKNLKHFGEIFPDAQRFLISQNAEGGNYQGITLLPLTQIGKILEEEDVLR